MQEKYADIIDLPHPEPKHHKRMPQSERAAQFSPFAALKGFHEGIKPVSDERETLKEIDIDGEV